MIPHAAFTPRSSSRAQSPFAVTTSACLFFFSLSWHVRMYVHGSIALLIVCSRSSSPSLAERARAWCVPSFLTREQRFLAAVWLLADKCLVAAHVFGPQHRYCLRAIGRLCREDLREAARPARAALRRRVTALADIRLALFNFVRVSVRAFCLFVVRGACRCKKNVAVVGEPVFRPVKGVPSFILTYVEPHR